MQKQEIFFFEGHRSTFYIKMPFGIGHLPTYTSIAVYMCVGGFKGPKSSNGIQLSRFSSKVMAFLVILLSLWSPHCPRCPHIIPVIPTSSPCHPHIIPIDPRRSPCGPHGCRLHGLHPMLSPWSPSSPHCPRHPHVIPIIPMSSPHCPHSLQKVPMWSPWLWSPWSPPHVVPMVPVVPTLSPSSPHHLEGLHIIPNPPDTHCTHPHPPGGGGPKSVKMQ